MNLCTSRISPDWWDYTCLPLEIVDEVARLTVRDLEKLSRPGFRVRQPIRNRSLRSI